MLAAGEEENSKKPKVTPKLQSSKNAVQGSQKVKFSNFTSTSLDCHCDLEHQYSIYKDLDIAICVSTGCFEKS